MRLSIPLALMTAALLVWPGPAGAATPEVRDEAGFFKPETIAAANKIISGIKSEDNKDLLIETFLQVPEGKKVDAGDATAVARFFTEWADQRATDAGVKGVYVLICKRPPYIKVVMDNQTAKTFTTANRDRLDQLLAASFRNMEYDDGLLKGVRYVQSTLKDKNAAIGDNVSSGDGVHDAAHFFKPEAITDANKIISAIKRDDKKELVIETFLHPPEGKRQEASDPETKADFFKDWADERGREQKVNGVCVLICKEPSYIQVVANNRTAKIFTEESRNSLRTILATHFKTGDYDKGLLEGVKYVQSALKGKGGAEQREGEAEPPWPTRSGPPAGRPSIGVGPMAIGGLLCVGVVVLIVIGVVVMAVMAMGRAFHRGPPSYGPGGYGSAPPGGGYGGNPGGGQGGGFLSSMLGGLFGGAAGGWAYDRFFGGRQEPNRGFPQREDGRTSPPPQDPGYTGGGGDFGGAGDTGGGGDFGGGGDSGGGGDFGGGGDAGGGGDFGGGGDTGGGGSF